MPYMPTNISPNHVTISKDEDIIFHCLIDKSDTIIGVKLTLYNYYDKNESAFIELTCTENINSREVSNSKDLELKDFNSSQLPFKAFEYETPVFALGIKENSTFFNRQIKTIGYKFEFTFQGDYSIFVLDGVIGEHTSYEESGTVVFPITYSSLIKPDNQVLINSNNNIYTFSYDKQPYFEDVVLISNDKLIYSLKEELTDYPDDYSLKSYFQLGLDINGKIYEIETHDKTKKTLQLKNTTDALALNIEFPKAARVVTLRLPIKTNSSFIQKATYEKELATDLTVLSGYECYWYMYDNYGSSSYMNYYVLGLRKVLSDAPDLNLEEVNKNKFYFKLGTVYKEVENIIKFDPDILDVRNYPPPDYTLLGTLTYSPTGTPPSYNEVDLYYRVTIADSTGNNNYYQIKTNILESYESVFDILESQPFIEIQSRQIHKVHGTFFGASTSMNSIEYSQWTLKDSFTNEIIYQTPKEYFTIKDFEYYFFKPNKIYSLELKVHDKRNFDYSSQIEVNTEEKNFEEIPLEKSAEVQDKYVKIDLNGVFPEPVVNYEVVEQSGKPKWSLNGGAQDVEAMIFRLNADASNTTSSDDYFKFVNSKDETLMIINKTTRKDNSIQFGAYIKTDNSTTEDDINGEFWGVKTTLDNKTETIICLIYKDGEDYRSRAIQISSQNKVIANNHSFPLKTLTGVTYDFQYLLGNTKTDWNIEIEINPSLEVIESLNQCSVGDSVSWSPRWDQQTCFSLMHYPSQNINRYLPPIDIIALRDEVDNEGNIVKSTLLKENLDSYNTYLYDYGAGQGKNYVYKIIALSQYLNTTVSSVFKTNEINTNDWYEVNLFGTKSHYRNAENGQYEIDENNLWSFELDADANNITFNASSTPNAESAFRYPKVTTSQKNYLSGTGTAYLGSLNQNGEYCKDTDKYLMDFANFASNGCVKILKLKNGMVIPVSINLKSSQNFANLNGNPTKITFDWVQVDSLDSSVTKGGEE